MSDEILSTNGVLKLLGWGKNKFAFNVHNYPLESLTPKELDECGHLMIRTLKYYRKQDVLDWAESLPNGKRRSSGPRNRKSN